MVAQLDAKIVSISVTSKVMFILNKLKIIIEQAAAMSPGQNSQKANVMRQARQANQEITEDSLKSPTMLKTTMDKEG